MRASFGAASFTVMPRPGPSGTFSMPSFKRVFLHRMGVPLPRRRFHLRRSRVGLSAFRSFGAAAPAAQGVLRSKSSAGAGSPTPDSSFPESNGSSGYLKPSAQASPSAMACHDIRCQVVRISFEHANRSRAQPLGVIARVPRPSSLPAIVPAPPGSDRRPVRSHRPWRISR
jgi:hypothetical protein